MFRKLVVSFLAIFTFSLSVFAIQAYALTGDRLYEKDVDFNYSLYMQTVKDIGNLFDNDDSTLTYMYGGSAVKVLFKQPVNINDLSLLFTGKGDFYFEFYSSETMNQKNLLSIVNVPISTNHVPVGLSNVKLVAVKQTGGTSEVYKIDFFDGDNLLPSVTTANVKTGVNSVVIDYVIDHAIALQVYDGKNKLLAEKEGSGVLKLDGLEPSTNYNFSLYAVDSKGVKSAQPFPVTFKTLDDPSKIPPGIVKTLVADDITYKSVKLRWKNPDDTDLSKAIFYDSDNKKIGEVDFNETEFFLDGLESEKSYSYSVKMLDKDGNLGSPIFVSFVTDKKPVVPDEIAPAAPTIIRVSSGDSVIDALWEFNNEFDFAGYNVYLDGVKVNSELVKTDTYKFSSLESGRVYKIEVEAVDYSGNKSEKATSEVKTKNPNVPKINMGSINLKNVADGISNWFGGLWLIIAFAVAIPLALMIAIRIKRLFVA